MPEQLYAFPADTARVLNRVALERLGHPQQLTGDTPINEGTHRRQFYLLETANPIDAADDSGPALVVGSGLGWMLRRVNDTTGGNKDKLERAKNAFGDDLDQIKVYNRDTIEHSADPANDEPPLMVMSDVYGTFWVVSGSMAKPPIIFKGPLAAASDSVAGSGTVSVCELSGANIIDIGEDETVYNPYAVSVEGGKYAVAVHNGEVYLACAAGGGTTDVCAWFNDLSVASASAVSYVLGTDGSNCYRVGLSDCDAMVSHA